MAYAYDFPNITGQLGGQASGDKDPNAQIFGGQQLTNGADTGAGGQTPDQSAQPKTTSDAATLTGATGGDGTAGANAKAGGDTATTGAVQPATQVDQADAVSRNVGQQSQPTAVGKAQTDLQSAQQGLQNEANSYLQGYQNTDYNVDHSQIDQAIGGDKSAQSSVRSRLTAAPDQAQTFAPTTKVDIGDINQLSTNAGVENLLRRDADPNYNAGEAAFDMEVLGRDPQFNQIRSLLQNQQAALDNTYQQDVGTGTNSLQSQAQNTINTNFASGTQDAQNYLTGKSGAIQGQLQDQATTIDQQRAALRQGGDQGFTQQQSQNTINDILAGYKADPTTLQRMQPYITNAGVDASKYFGVGNDVTWQDLASQDQANQFNNIMSLLGHGNSLQAGAGAGQNETFDAGGFKNAVVQAAQAQRQTADTQLQAQVNAIINSARARQAQLSQAPSQAAISNAIQANTTPIVQKLMQQYGSRAADLANGMGPGVVDPRQFLKPKTASTNFQDYLGQTDVSQLGGLYQQLGQANPYGKAGSYVNFDPFQGAFDSAGYEAALQAALTAPQGGGSKPSLGKDISDQFKPGSRVDQDGQAVNHAVDSFDNYTQLPSPKSLGRFGA